MPHQSKPNSIHPKHPHVAACGNAHYDASLSKMGQNPHSPTAYECCLVNSGNDASCCKKMHRDSHATPCRYGNDYYGYQ